MGRGGEAAEPWCGSACGERGKLDGEGLTPQPSLRKAWRGPGRRGWRRTGGGREGLQVKVTCRRSPTSARMGLPSNPRRAQPLAESCLREAWPQHRVGDEAWNSTGGAFSQWCSLSLMIWGARFPGRHAQSHKKPITPDMSSAGLQSHIFIKRKHFLTPWLPSTEMFQVLNFKF